MTAALATAEYAGARGQRVHYTVAGSGEPAVVLIHGWTCDSSLWQQQLSAFSKHFRVAAVDLLGHGQSDKPDTRYDLRLFSRGVLAAMDAAKINRAVLVGHSMGTGVIRQVFADAPERVIAIVSVDGSVLPDPPEALVTKVREWAATMKDASGLDVRRKFIAGMFTESTPAEVRKQVFEVMLAAPPHVAASAMENAIAAPIWSSRDQVTVPVLAVDRKRGDDRGRSSHQKVFSNLEYIEMPGVSHFLHLEKPEEFNRLAIEFIRKAAAR